MLLPVFFMVCYIYRQGSDARKRRKEHQEARKEGEGTRVFRILYAM
jgi:hypothetical protein